MARPAAGRGVRAEPAARTGLASRVRAGLRRPRDPAIRAKVEHRRRLHERAKAHWKRLGPRERAAYLSKVRAALLAEGFRSTRLQWRHRGHAFGLVRDRGDKQIHIRVYDTGLVDAEVEIHRRFVQHLVSPRPSAHRVVQRIFAKHAIPTQFINEHYLPKVGARRTKYPKRRTRVAHVIGGAVGLVGSVVAVSVVHLALRRMRRAHR